MTIMEIIAEQIWWEELGEAERDGYLLCLCKGCENTYEVSKQNLRAGKTTKCKDCSNALRKSSPNKVGHRLYSTWKSMHNRCNNPNNSSYKYYGGRGISVCLRWKNFWLFVEDMWTTYDEGLTLDRENNDGNYCKENCRWVTRKVQANNKRSNIEKIPYRGGWYTEAELADVTGIARTTLQQRRNLGYSDSEIVNGRPHRCLYPVEGKALNQKELASYLGISPQLLNIRFNKWGRTLQEVLNEFR